MFSLDLCAVGFEFLIADSFSAQLGKASEVVVSQFHDLRILCEAFDYISLCKRSKIAPNYVAILFFS